MILAPDDEIMTFDYFIIMIFLFFIYLLSFFFRSLVYFQNITSCVQTKHRLVSIQ